MGAQTFITPAGDEMVVLPMADYVTLLARAGDASAEDQMTARIVRETSEMIASGQDVALPEFVFEEIEAGQHPVAVIRRFRGMTQAALAREAGVSQGFISGLEQGGKAPSMSTLHKLGRALAVPGSLLVPPEGT